MAKHVALLHCVYAIAHIARIWWSGASLRSTSLRKDERGEARLRKPKTIMLHRQRLSRDAGSQVEGPWGSSSQVGDRSSHGHCQSFVYNLMIRIENKLSHSCSRLISADAIVISNEGLDP